MVSRRMWYRGKRGLKRLIILLVAHSHYHTEPVTEIWSQFIIYYRKNLESVHNEGEGQWRDEGRRGWIVLSLDHHMTDKCHVLVKIHPIKVTNIQADDRRLSCRYIYFFLFTFLQSMVGVTMQFWYHIASVLVNNLSNTGHQKSCRPSPTSCYFRDI